MGARGGALMLVLGVASTWGARLRAVPRRAPRAAVRAQSDATAATAPWGPDLPALRRARWALPSADAASKLGRALARVSKPGDVILLAGEVGMGKSTLARGFLKEVTRDELLVVSSPSYLLDITYPDPSGESLIPGATVHHMDLWRLASGQIAALVDLPAAYRQDVCLVEWPDRLGRAAPSAANCLLIELDQVEASSPAAGSRAEASAEREEEDEEAEDEDEERAATMSTYGEGWSARIKQITAEP
jgi:tRNA threonylcarbamoyladenosine biosynthesis protein TsaE